MARFSGRKLDAHEASISPSRYLFKVNKNLYLDAQDTAHMVGRYANCGRGNNNASFGAGRSATYDPIRKQWWISIYVTKNIKAGKEILVPYSAAYKFQKVTNATPAMASRATTESGNGKANNADEPTPKKNNRCQLAKITTGATKLATTAIQRAKEKLSATWEATTQYISNKAKATKAWADSTAIKIGLSENAPEQTQVAAAVTESMVRPNPTDAKSNKRTKWHTLLHGYSSPEGRPNPKAEIAERDPHNAKTQRWQANNSNDQNNAKLVVEDTEEAQNQQSKQDSNTIKQQNQRNAQKHNTKDTNGKNNDELVVESTTETPDRQSGQKGDKNKKRNESKAQRQAHTKATPTMNTNMRNNQDSVTPQPVFSKTAQKCSTTVWWPKQQKMAKIHRSEKLQYQPGIKRATRNEIPTICCPKQPIDMFIWAHGQRIKREKLAAKWTTTDCKIAIKAAKDRAHKRR